MAGSRSAAARELRVELENPAGYTGFHLPRYAYLLAILDRGLVGPDARILDFGLSAFTNVLRKRYGQRVDTLDLIDLEERQRGFEPENVEAGRHFVFDLNELESAQSKPEGLGPYDVVLFSEVLEHLRISPRYVFPFLASLLEPGGVLVVQTPNAAAIGKRVKLLLGRNPYEQISEDPRNPRHFREYTLKELRTLAAGAGLEVVSADYAAYFDVRFRHGGGRGKPVALLWRTLYSVVPPSWRPGMTVVLRRPDRDSRVQPPP